MADDERHEALAKEFVAALDRLLVDALKLAPEAHPAIFVRRDGLFQSLRALLQDNTYKAHRAERERIRAEVTAYFSR